MNCHTPKTPITGIIKAVLFLSALALALALTIRLSTAQSVRFGSPTQAADKVIIPVMVDIQDTICNVSLKFLYDTARLTYLMTDRFDTSLQQPGNFLIWCVTGDQWALSFFTDGSHSVMVEDTLCCVTFSLRANGCAALLWLDYLGNCELCDCGGNVWPVQYWDTTVCNYALCIEPRDQPHKADGPSYDLLGRQVNPKLNAVIFKR